MKWKLRLACAALLSATALPALALQLGEIQVKSALNQPLVAAIPLHPKNLTELSGLTVGLAAATDYQRAGLPLTPTDQTLRFHVVTDNNGQKLVLVTSSQPVTDPYLDFLIQVNTHEGKQVREFVVLLNPVVAAPAPTVQAAPVPSAAAAAPAAQPAELPPATQFPQPAVKPQPAPPPPVKAQPAPPPATPPPAQPVAPAAHAAADGPINVQRGDTLYHLAQQAVQGTDVSISQMMLAMQTANPDAFFKDNIDNLKAGAILRIPTRAQIDQRSVAAAAAEVRRQYAAWRSVAPHAATVVEGTAAEAAANAAPPAGKQAATSDHLTLAPPTGQAGGTSNRPGVAGGTGHATVAGLRQQLRADHDALISLNQSNTDLGSRIQNLEDLQTKSSQLLKLKDATVAELQHRLAAIQAGHAGTSATAAAKPSASATAHAAARPAAAAATPWYMRPFVWVIAVLVVLALIVLGLFGARRRTAPEVALQGPLDGPADAASLVDDTLATESAAAAPDAGTVAYPAAEPDVAAPAATGDDPYGLTALREPVTDDVTVVAPVAAPAPAAAPSAAAAQASADGISAGPLYSNDPIDTKLDLARAYLDMGDPVGARAMLEEVLEEGSQVQKDEASRLLAEAGD